MVPEPAAPEPVVPEPVVQEPAVPEPVVPEPAVPEPVPVVPEPVIPESVEQQQPPSRMSILAVCDTKEVCVCAPCEYRKNVLVNQLSDARTTTFTSK